MLLCNVVLQLRNTPYSASCFGLKLLLESHLVYFFLCYWESLLYCCKLYDLSGHFVCETHTSVYFRRFKPFREYLDVFLKSVNIRISTE